MVLIALFQFNIIDLDSVNYTIVAYFFFFLLIHCVISCRFILAWVWGLIWSEVKQLWDVGIEEYINDMWNVIDFVTNSLYVATVALRIVAYYRVQKENAGQMPGSIIELQREQWDTWDPMLISEGLFSAANIFRYVEK